MRMLVCGNLKGPPMPRFSYLLAALLTLPLYAETVSFQNDREGASYYSGKSTTKEINKVLRELDGEEIKQVYRSALNTFNDSNICSYDLNRLMNQQFSARRNGFREFEGAIHYLRAQNEIDDVVVKILVDAHKTATLKLDLPKDRRDLRIPRDRKAVDEMVKVIGSFDSRFEKNSCFDDAYRSLYSELRKTDKYMDSRDLEALLVEAYERKLINSGTYVALERARENELESTWITLKTYHQKKKSLRANKPLRDPLEKSEFVTDRYPKMNVSRRMRLMENYTDLQIMLMAEVVKKLRMRVEADRAEILIYRKDELQDQIVLEPMERFRLAVKLLRKEMALLGLNHYFNGRVPDYMDLITASYEVSAIPATELSELGSLEEIWNPKKTFWQKAQSWVRGVGSLGTILLPPPFGFIPSLAIVVIEMTTKKEDNNNGEDPTSLF